MGFFGGGGNNNEGGANDTLNQQLSQNAAELESKRMNLYKQRLDIIKSQGVQSWSPDRSASQSSSPQTGGFPLGKSN